VKIEGLIKEDEEIKVDAGKIEGVPVWRFLIRLSRKWR